MLIECRSLTVYYNLHPPPPPPNPSAEDARPSSSTPYPLPRPPAPPAERSAGAIDSLLCLPSLTGESVLMSGPQIAGGHRGGRVSHCRGQIQ